MKSIKEITEAYYSGEKLSDCEILFGFDHFKEAYKLLRPMGERFSLVSNEILKLEQSFESIAENRKII